VSSGNHRPFPVAVRRLASSLQPPALARTMAAPVPFFHVRGRLPPTMQKDSNGTGRGSVGKRSTETYAVFNESFSYGSTHASSEQGKSGDSASCEQTMGTRPFW
jgi:hypothetical protein